MGKDGSAGVAQLPELLSALQTVAESWQKVGLRKLMDQCDPDARTVLVSKEKLKQSRGELTQRTKQWMRLPDDARLQAATGDSGLIRAYQRHVDELASNLSFAEAKFLELYKQFAEAVDPVPSMSAVAGARSSVVHLLQQERELRGALAARDVEVSDLRKSEQEVLRLRGELGRGEDEVRELVDGRVRAGVREQEQVAAGLRERVSALEADLRRTRVEAREHLAAKLRAEEEALAAQARAEEIQSRVDWRESLLSDDCGRLQGRVAELELRLSQAPPTQLPAISNGAADAAEAEIQLLEERVAAARECQSGAERERDAAKRQTADAEARCELLEPSAPQQNAALSGTVAQLRATAQPASPPAPAAPPRSRSIPRRPDADSEEEVARLRAALADAERRLRGFESIDAPATRDPASAGDKFDIAAVVDDVQGEAPTAVQVVARQRDALRAELRARESRQLGLLNDLDELRQQREKLQQDNVSLYERVRFLQHRVDAAASSSIPAAGTTPDPTEKRYRRLYEQQLDPLSEFRAKQREEQARRLGPADRVALSCGRLIFLSRVARLFVVGYTILLHAVVFAVLYAAAHTRHAVRQPLRP